MLRWLVARKPAGRRSDLENGAAVNAEMVGTAGRNIAADFLTSCTFWADGFESGQAEPLGQPL
jgi:hypothetical protein